MGFSGNPLLKAFLRGRGGRNASYLENDGCPCVLYVGLTPTVSWDRRVLLLQCLKIDLMQPVCSAGVQREGHAVSYWVGWD